jgi:retron-type reverse transcriptase
MIRHETPAVLMDWTENMLVGRNLTGYKGETTTEGKPHKGCPQSGVLSPLLWCLVVNDPLLALQREGFHAYDYADDIASGHFLTALRDLTDSALKITQKWCKINGLTANLLKSNTMVFTTKSKRESVQPPKLEGKEITFK